MGNDSAICGRHLGEKQFAPIGLGNLAIQWRRTASSSTLSQKTRAPARIDSFSLKTAIRKCFFYFVKTRLTEFFRKIIIEGNLPSC